MSSQESAPPNDHTIETDVSARMDRLPWSSWHWMIITALGTSWLLDGLQVTLAGSLAGILEDKSGLALTDPQVAAGATTYLTGAVLGAILFGYLTDRLGRRKLFLITLATYSIATLATAFSWNFLSFAAFRLLTGLGIGGEYAAINSAVDELIHGKVRGTVDQIVNGTFWLGAAIGSGASFYLLSGHGIPPNVGWRVAFGIGAVLGCGVLLLRLRVPESPRWLVLRGHEEHANKVVGEIEERIKKQKGDLPAPEGDKLKIAVRTTLPGKTSLTTCLERIVSAPSWTDVDGCSGVLLQCRLLHLWAGGKEILPCVGYGLPDLLYRLAC